MDEVAEAEQGRDLTSEKRASDELHATTSATAQGQPSGVINLLHGF